MPPPPKSVALIGSYMPRKCGIATFTADLAAAILENNPEIDCSIVAMNDRPDGYEYPDEVKFQISQDKLSEYSLAADFLNLRNPAVISLQHEYGIFGGQRGSYIIELAKNLKSPLFTTLHTVLREPLPEERKIIDQLSKLSAGLIVMSEHAANFLQDIYQVPASKIALIHHGVLDVPFLDPDPCKSKLGADDKTVILTFGLLSPGKGIEFMIDALPDIVRLHPDVLYYVVGATHPHCKAESGEDYRLSLHHQAKELGVGDNIVFHDRFLERSELLEIIRAADIYVTPYLNEAQVVSGTLAYAVGAGKAVVSTPYWHAQEMLADGRGRLVPFEDSRALAQQVNQLLDCPEERLTIRRAAYDYSRPMVMKEMGRHYLALFSQSKAPHARPRDLPALDTLGQSDQRLPQVNLKHLRSMTDNTGVLQHARFTVPNRAHGYCADDCSRALIVTVRAHDLDRTDTSLTDLSSIYLSFLDDAFDPGTGRFRNFMSYDCKWLETIGSEDSHGRALWALGVMAGWGHSPGQVALAETIFHDALPALENFSYSRAIAFPILGMKAYLRRHENDQQVRELIGLLGDRLLARFRQCATKDWRWYEPILTYDNARVPEALMACGRVTNDDRIVKAGINALEWLRDIQLDPSGGWFTPVGNHGWFSRSGSKAQFDQQPLEAAAMIGASLEAYACTQREEWIQLASTCFNWYLGKNDQQIQLYDAATGGCRDGLTADGVNENQGAESTLSYLSSLLAIYNLRGLTASQDHIVESDTDQRLAGQADAA
ncbi:MAG: glycosyltransferase family 4 protein [Gammaproteobacteria bacterium]|nr:glycosyltransferase family 4 protein [Gammaproteobacteria bacterium]